MARRWQTETARRDCGMLGAMPARVLGIDVASARWADNGTALVEIDGDAIVRLSTGVIAWPDVPLTARASADAIDAFARAHEVVAVAIDGPQGWRDPDTNPALPGVGRRCEHACRTQGKTGAYPQTFPATQRGWIEHSVALFDALLAKPDVALIDREPAIARAGYRVLECFPTSTWRTSGLAPLPAKARRPALQPFVAALRAAFALPDFACERHDDLQAVVAALAAVAAIGGPVRAIVHGVPARIDGSGRRLEGTIWDAVPLGGPVPRNAATLYGEDLAYVHAVAFGEHARAAGPCRRDPTLRRREARAPQREIARVAPYCSWIPRALRWQQMPVESSNRPVPARRLRCSPASG